MHEHLELLGYAVVDKITGLKGVVTSISFDLYGCVGGLVTPSKIDKQQKLGESYWFDTKRLQKTSKGPVMEIPTFETIPGGQDRPQPMKQPVR